MTYLRLAVTAVILFFCGCAVQQSEAMNWKSLPGVQQYLGESRRARRMVEGPLGPIIDLIIELIIKLIEIILSELPVRAKLESAIALSQG